MKSGQAHTPTPWEAGQRQIYANFVWSIRGPGATPIVSRVMRSDDAAFIVRACNAHDELVSMLRDLVNAAQLLLDGELHPRDLEDVISEARVEIKSATA